MVAGTGSWTVGASDAVVTGIGAGVVSGMGVSGAAVGVEVDTNGADSPAVVEDSLETTGVRDRVTTTEDEDVLVIVVVVVGSGIGVGVMVM